MAPPPTVTLFYGGLRALRFSLNANGRRHVRDAARQSEPCRLRNSHDRFAVACRRVRPKPAVRGVPSAAARESVVVVLTEQPIVVCSAVQRVVAGLAVERVRAVVAAQVVVAGAAPQGVVAVVAP